MFTEHQLNMMHAMLVAGIGHGLQHQDHTTVSAKKVLVPGLSPHPRPDPS